MSSFSRLLLAVVTTLLTACASAPPQPQGPRPAALAGQALALVPSPRVQQTSHTQQHLDAAQTLVYMQNHGGGGAGLGVLLGPLGVAANISMIEGVTQADVARLKGRLQADPVAAFRQAAADQGLRLVEAAGAGVTRATPYLLFSKTDPTTLHVGTVLLLEGPPAAAPDQPWRGHYQLQLPLQYTLESLATLDDAGQRRLQAEARQGFAALLGQILRDTPEAAAREPQLHFQSPYLTPRFEFEQAGTLVGTDGGRVWLRTAGGLFAVQPDQVRYTLDKR